MSTARDAIERHAQAINDRDLDAYRRSMNFPFTYQNYNGVALTIDNEAELGVAATLPWAIILRSDPDWSHTSFDAIEPVAQSPSSAVFKVVFRRIDTSGASEGSYAAIWIATCKHDHWGVQFRHNLGQTTPGSEAATSP